MLQPIRRRKEAAMTGFIYETSVGETRMVARRQFIGSVIAGILVVAVVALLALRPAHVSTFATTTHSGVQQAVFVAPPVHMIASAKRVIETP
jgi:hypothetical protein